QVVDPADAPVGHDQGADFGPVRVGQFVVHQLQGGFAEDADGAPHQPQGHQPAGDGVDPIDPRQADGGDADQGDGVGRQVRRVVGPVARDGDGTGFPQRPALDDDQAGGQ